MPRPWYNKFMQQILAQKKTMILAAVAVLLLVLGSGAYMLLGVGQKQPTPSTVDQTQQTQPMPTLDPSAIGMSLVVTKQGKTVTMTIDKPAGITSISYEVTYTANSNGNNVSRGVIGTINVGTGDTKETQEVVLGTCSDVCHYDKVVSPVKFSLKVTKTDGKVYEVDQSISL